MAKNINQVSGSREEEYSFARPKDQKLERIFRVVIGTLSLVNSSHKIAVGGQPDGAFRALAGEGRDLDDCVLKVTADGVSSATFETAAPQPAELMQLYYYM